MGVITKDKQQDNSSTDEAEAKSAEQSEKEQTRQSESESLGLPILLEGTRVKIIKGDNEGRMAVITGLEFSRVEDQIQFQTPNHPGRLFVKPEHYIVTTRDSRNEVLYEPPENVKALSTTEGWARGEG